MTSEWILTAGHCCAEHHSEVLCSLLVGEFSKAADCFVKNVREGFAGADGFGEESTGRPTGGLRVVDGRL